MNSILSVFKRETFIKRSVWENFYDSLKRLIENGRIDQNSVVNLFYNNFIEKELRYITDQDTETLDDDKVIELLDSANKKSSESAQKSREQFNEEITLKEKEFRDKILSISSDGEDRLAKERRQTIEVLEFRSRRLAHRVVFSIRILAGLLLILPIYPLIGQIKNNGVTYDLPAITRYVFFVLDTIAISIGELWHKLENRIYKKRLKKELQNFKIEHQM